MEEQPFKDGFYGVLGRGISKIFTDYGFTANPFHSVWKNVEIQLRSVPAHEKHMSNLTCHNLCKTTHVRLSDTKLIGLGLNCCITRLPPDAPNFERFKRSVRIRYQFAGAKTTEYIPKLYVPVPDWMPQDAAPAIEDAINTFEERLTQLHQSTQNPRLNKPNLPPAQLKRLDEIRNDPRIIVIPTDKNLGPAILDRGDYIDHCLNGHLLNNDNYVRLQEDDARKICYNARASLQRLTIQDKKLFPAESQAFKYFYRSLKVRGRRRPQFYIMPKIHKNPLKTRPVISCVGSTMEIASKYLDYQLQRVVHLCPCYLKDSWQLLKQLKDLGPLPAGARLVTADAVSMYSNIHTDHGVASVRAWLIRHSTDDKFPDDLRPIAMIEMLCKLLRLVMTTNVFDLDDTTWHQRTGTAMGTSVACVYATIYYSQHEELSLLDPTKHDLGIMFYRRFIDDAFIIMLVRDRPDRYPHLRQTLNSFGEEGRRLEWTSDPPSKTVNFLDLTIQIGDDRRISTKTFQKAMNLFLYIPPVSSHSNCVLYGLIFGQLRRFWLQNSLTDDYIHCARAFQNHLLARGHDSDNIQSLFRLAAAQFDQPSRLEPATPTGPTTDATVFLHMEFHPRQIERMDIQKVFREVCAGPLHDTANKEKQQTGIERLTIAHSRPPNLRDLLCRTKMELPENERVSDHINNYG